MDIDLPEVAGRSERGSSSATKKRWCRTTSPCSTQLFRDDPRTLRYGGGENLYGYGEITAFRAARSPVGLMRRYRKTVITTYGRDFAVASTLFYRDTAPGKVGRQMQTWVRFPEGWRIVAAHVSIIDEPRVQSA